MCLQYFSIAIDYCCRCAHVCCLVQEAVFEGGLSTPEGEREDIYIYMLLLLSSLSSTLRRLRTGAERGHEEACLGLEKRAPAHFASENWGRCVHMQTGRLHSKAHAAAVQHWGTAATVSAASGTRLVVAVVF